MKPFNPIKRRQSRKEVAVSRQEMYLLRQIKNGI